MRLWCNSNSKHLKKNQFPFQHYSRGKQFRIMMSICWTKAHLDIVGSSESKKGPGGAMALLSEERND